MNKLRTEYFVNVSVGSVRDCREHCCTPKSVTQILAVPIIQDFASEPCDAWQTWIITVKPFHLLGMKVYFCKISAEESFQLMR